MLKKGGENLKIFVPAEICKSSKDKEMRIMGFASTPNMDRQNETVVQQGLDIKDFVEYGFFNLDHDNSCILGYPDKERTKVTNEGLYVEGTILPTKEGNRIWETAVALQKSNAPRKLGFSIEGKVLERDTQGKIKKAKVYNVAITSTPVNPEATWQALVKSMTTADDSGGALIEESLEHATNFLQRVKNGEETSTSVLNSLLDNLNKSTNPKDIETYLSVFKGYYGDNLKTTVDKVVKEMEDNKK